MQIVVIAPSPALRVGLRAMLQSGGLDVADAVGSSEDARARGASVLVCQGVNTLDVAPQAGVALVLLSDDPADLTRLAHAGWAGWALLPEDTSASDLHAAVVAAARGMAVMDPASARAALPAPSMPAPGDVVLTAREQQMLELVSRGLPNKAIAAQLRISDSTVKFHLQSAFAKLGAASRAEAVSTAARLGLITL